jgi:glycosyltransferase involved in cell wall biosynthesis
MTSQPLVSIGIPVRNGGEHLERAVESALAQDHPNVEVVVSDNASSDSTPEICSRYGRDKRIRYRRNDSDIGAVENFTAVLKAARGTYFTWLAHDDALPLDYVSTIVSFLSQHPDVLLCGTDFEILDWEHEGHRYVEELSAIRPEKAWDEARAEFFRWPQSKMYYVFYGVYRRTALLSAPLLPRTYRGRPVIRLIEFPVLTALAARGRIVALERPRRQYQTRHDSSAVVENMQMSNLYRLWLSLQTRGLLLRRALAVRDRPRQRAELIATTLRNFLVLSVGRDGSYRAQRRELRRELSMLRSVAEERLDLLERYPRPLRGAVPLVELRWEIGLYREVCDRRLARIEALHLASEQTPAGEQSAGSYDGRDAAHARGASDLPGRGETI